MRRIYLDYAASTPLGKEVKKAMDPFWDKKFANPGGIHREGLEAKKALENSRKEASLILGSKDREVIFTSGGTESNSLAIIGFLNNLQSESQLKGTHIITSEVEHPSVLEVFKSYENAGVEVSFLGVKEDGLFDLDDLKKTLRPETSLVSLVFVNSEIGTVQPIRKISKIIKDYNPKITFHTDASQAPLFFNVSPESLQVDMLTLDGVKMYGPKGVGILYKKEKINISPVLIGGSQEMGLRPGTENIPLIVGFSKAFQIAAKERDSLSEKILKMRDFFIDSLKEIDGLNFNGSLKFRSPNNINISIAEVDSEFLALELDRNGVACSTRSACIGKETQGSYVIKSLGKNNDGLRFTLGRETTIDEIRETVMVLKRILNS